MKRLRLHDLPWPSQALDEIGFEDVELTITLSYFVEPSTTNRGWRRNFTYASHGLRFDLKDGSESYEEFLSRVGNNSPETRTRSSSSERWTIGPRNRHIGSVHKDIWTGSGNELAACDAIAIFPVGGWWKYNRRKDRRSHTVRYALLVSLKTDMANVDLYTPIVNELQVPIATPTT